jgi:hypothetical protein
MAVCGLLPGNAMGVNRELKHDLALVLLHATNAGYVRGTDIHLQHVEQRKKGEKTVDMLSHAPTDLGDESIVGSRVRTKTIIG